MSGTFIFQSLSYHNISQIVFFNPWLAEDGFNLQEIAECMIYPEFEKEGGVESERTFVKQMVQKYIDSGAPDDAFTDPMVNS